MSGLTLLVLPSLALAGTVTQNKNDKVIVDFAREDTPAANDRFFILDQETHKEIGIIEILKTKESRALGKLLKGKAKPGDTTDIAKPGRKKTEEDREPAESNVVNTRNRRAGGERSSGKKSNFGVGLNFVFTSVYIKNSVGDGAVTGSGFGVRGFFDMPFSSSSGPGFNLTASAGIHPFNVKSTIAEFSYEVNGTLLALEGVVRYAFERRNQGFWIGGGIDLMTPINSTTTEKPKSQTAPVGSGGINFKTGSGFISIRGDFFLLPSNSYQMALGGAYFF